MISSILALVLSMKGSFAGNPEPKSQIPSFATWKKAGTAIQIVSRDQAAKLGIQNITDDQVITSKMEGDEPMGRLTSPAFKIEKKFIAFRISGGHYEHHTCLNLLVHGKIVRSATGRQSDWMTPESWDVSAFRGQKVQLEVVDDARGDWGHIDVDRIEQTDQPEQNPTDVGTLYHETLRPQFHLTARQWTTHKLNPGMREEGWINDLNGLIYYDGEYHLFAQRWNKCWLHAISKDLVHWQELEPAFWEESLGSGTQSGTCVIDYENSSGLATDKAHPAMIAFWSRADNRGQCFSYSLDHGRTWKLGPKMPFMDMPERDPKVFWFSHTGRWVMLLYGDGQYHIFTSRNLRDWTDEKHPIPNSFECPDFFELAVDDSPVNKKWVLIQGNGNYSIGAFDGFRFYEEGQRHACDVGPNFYATQSWHNVETGDGRRIQAAWMRGSDFPNMPFNQMISFPCELTLRSTPKGPRIFREPVKEIEKLHLGLESIRERTLNSDRPLPLKGRLLHIKMDVEIPEGSSLIVDVCGVPVNLTSRTIANGSDPVAVQDHIQTLELLIDRTSIEAFVNHGEISSTRFMLPTNDHISLRVEGSPVKIHSLDSYTLKSIWNEK